MIDIDEIKARLTAATPGPYLVETGEYSGANWLLATGTGRNGKNYFITTKHRRSDELSDSAADAEFFAHAREDVPALVGEVEQLRQRNAKMLAALRDIHDAVRAAGIRHQRNKINRRNEGDE